MSGKDHLRVGRSNAAITLMYPVEAMEDETLEPQADDAEEGNGSDDAAEEVGEEAEPEEIAV